MNYKNLLSIILIIFFGTSLSYLYYKSEIINEGLIRYHYKKYFILSFVSLFLFYILKNLSELWNKKFFYILIFFIFSTYIFEVILFYNGKNFELKREKYFKKYLKNYEISYEKRDKFDVYLDKKKNNQNIFLATDPYHFIKDNTDIFPLSSYANIETILCNEYGLLSVYESDRYGFSNPDYEWDNEIDYLIVGDSFVHGNCVNQKDSISGVLRKMNGGKGVLNLGFGGNGPLIEYAQLREYLDLINVKRVLWFYSETDDLEGPDFRDPGKFEGLKAELSNKILKRYYDDQNFRQGLANKQDLVDELSYKKNEKILDIIERSKKNKNNLENIIKLRNLRKFAIKILNSKNNKKINQKISDEFMKIITNANKIFKEKNIEFYFIYVTDIDRYSKSYFDLEENNYDKIKEFIIKSDRIKLIDLHEELFKNLENPLSLFTKQFQNEYQYYNIEGHKLVAEKIHKIINTK
tara:strand:- start:1543 stop:2937 length:1395 start_codon:yes stop_codon:yes gene_type:complete